MKSYGFLNSLSDLAAALPAPVFLGAVATKFPSPNTSSKKAFYIGLIPVIYTAKNNPIIF